MNHSAAVQDPSGRLQRSQLRSPIIALFGIGKPTRANLKLAGESHQKLIISLALNSAMRQRAQKYFELSCTEDSQMNKDCMSHSHKIIMPILRYDVQFGIF
jgi:hypothetical protein